MYQSDINNTYQTTINSTEFEWDLLEIKEGKFHILKDNQSFEATVLAADYATKTFTIKINRNSYEVKLKDKFDLLVEQLGFSNMVSQKVNNIKAPMPGLVLDVMVEVGDTIAKGDSVLILEAMKMENVIKAEGDAVVKSIEIEKGTAVEKNQVLVEFE
ncbi:acetyl-CoA carboxylase biotin carboxyl carrier protein subunit [Aureispira anguillae]|uniref:Acetyl-CoA carboxylase biotin carboxyl carrier protein subunit n=1 Tax=Aureispira anguillae TaxID=2864201 RepID=A0A915YFN6_9BACT|nr:biotin/lipoyl-containing protein [Aureispira anguillae]BDS12165.1 acetyl-CoA carboxylase biotin carboxyl carrier protein subunit [Aureispira anguillae]